MAEWTDKKLVARVKHAKSNVMHWHSMLDEAYRFFCPTRNTMFEQTPGNNRRKDLFTSVAEDALEEFANTIKAKLLPSNVHWASMVAGGEIEREKERGDIDDDDLKEFNSKLDTINRTLFSFIQQSNFDQAAHESIQDMAVSVGAMLCLDNNSKEDPLRFVAVPASEIIPENGPDGDTKSAYREYKIMARDVDTQWPKRKKGDNNLDKIINDKPETKLDCIEGTIFDPKTKKYDYVVHIKQASNKIIFTDTYDVSPWIIFRWLVSPGEVMGRGPAIKALNDVRVYNKLRSQLLRNNDMAINPPLMMNGSALAIDPANVKIKPGAKIVTKMNYAMKNEPLRFLENGSNFQVGQYMNAEYKDDIKRMFYAGVLGPVDAPVKSATEVSIRDRRDLDQVGAAISRLENELIRKTIARVYDILKKYQYVPPNLKINGVQINVKATGPLSRLQDRTDIENLVGYFQTANQMVGPEQGPALAASAVDMSELGGFLAAASNVPGKLRMTKKQQAAQAEKVTKAAQGVSNEQEQ